MGEIEASKVKEEGYLRGYYHVISSELNINH
jgi:hypothetical protein